MAHTPAEQQFLLDRQRICDGELPFLKTSFEGDGWRRTFSGSETYLLMACYYRQKSVIEYLAYQAARNINKPEVREWLKVVTPEDNSPLHNYLCSSALPYRRKTRQTNLPILTSVIKLLVSSLGFDVNAFNSYGETPFYMAVCRNDTNAVDTILQLGGDINQQCCDIQETVLHKACIMSDHDMFDMLLRVEGLDVNATNMLGWSPLHVAAQYGDTYKVGKLLERGARAEVESLRGDTPIFFSMQTKSEENATFSLLFQHISSNFSREEATSQFLHINGKGESLLDCAVKNQHFIALKILLEEGLFDIHHRDSQGKSLLHLSVSHAPNWDIINFLLGKGLSPNERDAVGNTPLMYFFKQSRASPSKSGAGAGVAKPMPNVNV